MTINAKPKWLVQSTADIARHEGFREFAYPDPLSRLGRKYQGTRWQWGFQPADVLLMKYGESERDGRPWTVGYGFTHGVTPQTKMSKQFADQKLEGVVIEHTKLLDRLIPEWIKMPLFAQTVLVNMAYNLGNRLAPFAPTLNVFKKGDWSGAADRLTRTAWYKQVGSRAVELTTRLRRKEIDVKHLVVPNERGGKF
jgi:GH24 family phage-related lysozyme (muramidase)